VKKLSVLLVVVMLATLFAACAAPAPQVVEKVITQEVEKVVTQQVEVEKVVTQQVEVEKVITQEVEKVVTSTPEPVEVACKIDPQEKPTVINMIGWSFPITDFYAAELEKCSKVKNLTVNTQLLSGADAQEQVQLALSAGGDSPYDIVHGANNQVTAWGAPGWLLPLNDLIEKYRDEYNLDDIPQTVWDGVTLDGKIYGVPMVGNTFNVIYRKDVFDKLGIKPPETYDDAIAICKTIGLDNPDWDMPFSIADLSYARGWEVEFFQVLRAFGGDYLDKDNQPIFNNEAGVKALEKMGEVVNACYGKTGLSISLNDQEIALEKGTMPGAKMWASRAANMSDPKRTDLVDVLAYAPAPRTVAGGPRAASAWNDYYMIPAKTTKDPELIFRIIMEAGDEASQKVAASFGMPTRNSAMAFGGPYLPAANQSIAEGIGIYDKNRAVSIAVAKLSEFLPLTGTGDMTPQAALDAAAKAYVEEATAQGFIK
jgi:ABC-type glycerol-3-phosphate transport system substrate-binding protein